MSKIGASIGRCLILPSSLYWLAWGAAALAIVLSWSAGNIGDSETARCCSTCPTNFLAADPPLADICALGGAVQQADCAEQDRAAPCNCSSCERQCLARQKHIGETKEEIRTACSRRSHYQDRIVIEPLARRVIAEEGVELRRLHGKLRELQGPKPEEESRENVRHLAETCVLGLAALYGYGRHARNVGIPRCRRFTAIRPAFMATGGVTLLVAVTVIMVESLDEAKVGFDWSSFCINRAAFWVNHATVLPLALLIATQLSAGFFAMRDTHLPEPNPTKPAWGVRSYVTFLETWCFLLVIIVGAVAARWLHELAAERTRTNVILSFLGWGALGSAAALAVRIVRTAITLRDKCEALALTVDKAPAPPTDHLVGKSWWQVPAVFAAAGSIAWWLLEKSDALKLYTAP